MSKSRIIKQLINDEVELTEVFRRVYVLANDINNNAVKDWARRELDGYQKEEDIPSYRVFHSTDVKYSGINGSYQVTNVPLPLGYLSIESVAKIKEIQCREPIAELCEHAKSTRELYRDVTFLAPEVERNSSDGIMGIQCVEIKQMINVGCYKKIVERIKNQLLDILLEFEKSFGCLDDLDIDTSKLKKKELNELFANLGVIINANKVKIKGSNVGSGSNTTNKTTEVNIETEVNVAKEDKKGCFWGRLFRRKK